MSKGSCLLVSHPGPRVGIMLPCQTNSRILSSVVVVGRDPRVFEPEPLTIRVIFERLNQHDTLIGNCNFRPRKTPEWIKFVWKFPY